MDYSKLTNDINHWIEYEELISKLNKNIKQLREKKNNLEEHILISLKENNLDNKKLKIANNHITYNITNTLPPISLKLLETILSQLLNEDSKTKIIEKIHQFREDNKSKIISLKKKQIKLNKSLKS